MKENRKTKKEKPNKKVEKKSMKSVIINERVVSDLLPVHQGLGNKHTWLGQGSKSLVFD